MAGLDLRTVVIMSGILALLLAVVMLFMRLGYPRSIRGLALWALAPLLVGLSTFLFAARGYMPDLLSIVGANLLLLGGALSYLFGSQLFFGRQPTWWRWLPVLGGVAVLLVWLGVIQPDFNRRVQLVSFVWAAIVLNTALVIWRNGPEVFATRYTVIVLVLHAGVIILRLLASLLPLPDEGLFVPTRVQTVYVTASALMVVAFVLGLVLMTAERVRGELEGHATLDALTGTLMRRVLIDAAEQELARCHRHGRSMALLMLDIDHFKVINDTHGHQMGDRVLVDFVGRIRPLLRRPDQLGRYGGEEFLLLLPETTQEEAVAVAERIRAAVAGRHGELPDITVSIGVAANRADEARIDLLLGRADRALYKAKAEGRNRIATA